MTKLDWNLEHGEYVALIGDNYRARAVHDSDAENPFTSSECEWPVVVRDGDKFDTYIAGRYSRGTGADNIIDMPDAMLIHNQHLILRALKWPCDGNNTADAMRNAMESYLTDEPVGYIRDADILRDLFSEILSDIAPEDRFDVEVEMRFLAGHYAYTTQVTGHCQGDWADVLVVAAPQHIEAFGCQSRVDEMRQDVLTTGETDERRIWDEVSRRLLEPTADLYEHWAFGNCWGVIVEKRLPDEEDEEAEEADDDDVAWTEHESCYGFYGDDFEASGLSETALDLVPNEEKVDG